MLLDLFQGAIKVLAKIFQSIRDPSQPMNVALLSVSRTGGGDEGGRSGEADCDVEWVSLSRLVTEGQTTQIERGYRVKHRVQRMRARSAKAGYCYILHPQQS